VRGIYGVSADNRLKIIIVTGLSGAGKSQAVDTFEDAGYFCIDNMPPEMLPRIAELFSLEGSRVDKVALVFDARGGRYFERLDQALSELSGWSADIRILFLEASDDAIVARFQSTRRPHPLSHTCGGLLAGIRTERSMLAGLRERADVVIDTTGLNVHELRRRIQESMLAGELYDRLLLTFVSFGYKYGLPLEADVVLDARFLPNPYWVSDLRPLTGLDEAVKDYVLTRPETHGFLERAAALLRYLLPLYTAERKTQLLVAVGCTGGRHRSVALAEALSGLFEKDPEVTTMVRHRDLDRGA
jgi:RNase adapter protein RapZ